MKKLTLTLVGLLAVLTTWGECESEGNDDTVIVTD
jgi:hypothetical protein